MLGNTALKASLEMHFQVTWSSPLLMVLRPRIDSRQWVVQDGFFVQPMVDVKEYLDSHGNRCQRFTLPEGRCSIRSEVVAHVGPELPLNGEAGFVPIPDLPDGVIQYLLPSRYCESDRFGGLAQDIVGDAAPGAAQVYRLCEWLRANVSYRPGSSATLVSASEVLDRGEGVCRDLAHLGITLCRALSIPARYVSGYLQDLDPMDLHAWFEVWLGEGWQGFDPTQSTRKGGRIVMAVGRDGADAPLYNQFGPPLIPESMSVTVDRISGNRS